MDWSSRKEKHAAPKPVSHEARWNLWLVNCGEPPMLYLKDLTEADAYNFMRRAASKAFDGSDADGFVMMRSDYPIPAVWPEKIRR